MDPALWWYLARVGGLMSWWLLSATVLWGLLVASRVLGPQVSRARLFDLHRFLSGLALAFLALHLISLLADTWVDISVFELLLPFLSGYRPVAVAWGVIALYLVAAIQVTSLLKHRIAHRWWRYIHWSAFAAFALSTLHAFTAGTDTATVQGTGIALIAAVAFLALYRLLGGRRADRPTGTSARSESNVADGTRRPQFHRLTVTDVRRETADAVSVNFDVPPELGTVFRFQPGQHVTVRTTIDGRSVPRPYSICTAATDDGIRIAVKAEPDGLMSHHLSTRVRPGDVLEVAPPAGRFGTVPEPQRNRHILGIAAGSGITTILSIVASVLTVERQSRCTVLYGNRDRGAVMLHDELDHLTRRYPGRLRVLHLLSREHPEDSRLHGRITADKLRELSDAGLVDFADIDEAFVCGPVTMADDVTAALPDLGIDPPAIQREIFTKPASTAPPAARESAPDALVTTIFEGAVTDVPAYRDEPILDATLRAGLQVPYSCRSGDCFTCEARLVAGHVRGDDAAPRPGTVLTCQSKPAADRLVVDFDRA